MRHFSPAILVEAHALTDEAALTARKRRALSDSAARRSQAVLNFRA
jgi:hypothetical protein